MTLKYAGTMPRLRIATKARHAAVVRAIIMRALVRLVCASPRVAGRERIPHGPVIVVANHASHADTPLVIAALGPRRIAPAAAADYFFRNRVVGALTRVVIGAFPFPRRGTAGLERAHARLRAGSSVLLFPEGTRTTDGTVGPFKTGAARLAVRDGITILPAGIAGTRDVLPKGGRMPRRRSVAVVFGEPIRVARGADAVAITDAAEASVVRAAAQAEALRAPRRPPVRARVHALASSRGGICLAFLWAAAEALAWPIVPDLAVATLVLAAPRRMLHIAAAAVAGSVAGGIIAYGLGGLGAAGVLDHVPLVTERMQTEALRRMSEDGAAGILSQPWSGIPYKVFAYQAADAGAGPGGFLIHSLLARGARIFQVAAIFAAGSFLLRGRLARLYPWAVGVYTVVFLYGLSRVVAAWR